MSHEIPNIPNTADELINIIDSYSAKNPEDVPKEYVDSREEHNANSPEEKDMLELAKGIDEQLESLYGELLGEKYEGEQLAETKKLMRSAFGYGYIVARRDDGSFIKKYGFRDPAHKGPLNF